MRIGVKRQSLTINRESQIANRQSTIVNRQLSGLFGEDHVVVLEQRALGPFYLNDALVVL